MDTEFDGSPGLEETKGVKTKSARACPAATTTPAAIRTTAGRRFLGNHAININLSLPFCPAELFAPHGVMRQKTIHAMPPYETWAISAPFKLRQTPGKTARQRLEAKPHHFVIRPRCFKTRWLKIKGLTGRMGLGKGLSLLPKLMRVPEPRGRKTTADRTGLFPSPRAKVGPVSDPAARRERVENHRMYCTPEQAALSKLFAHYSPSGMKSPSRCGHVSLCEYWS